MKRFYLTLIIFSLVLTSSLFAQKAYEMEVRNLVQVNETEFTFDIRMRNVSNPFEPFAIEAIQWQLSFNTGMLNGGQLRNLYLTYVSGTTDLVGVQIVPTNANFTTNQLVMQWVTNALNIDDETTFFGDTQWKRIGTFRVRLSLDGTATLHNFADVNPNLQFVTAPVNQVIVNYCNYYEDEGIYYRSDAFFGTITNQTLTNSISPTFQLSGYYMNTGTDWATSGNWNNTLAISHPAYQQLPGAANNALVGVSANVSGSTSVTVKNVYLKSTGSLSLASGSSLIHSNSGVQAVANRVLPGSPLAWHTIAAPVTAMSIAGSNFEPGANDDFYMWHEPSPGTWVNYKNQDGTGGSPSFPAANGGNNFAVGRGYLVAYDAANPTKTFSGALNAGNVNVVLNKSGSKSWTYEAGWNLIGNPYASSLNFSALSTVGVLAENFAQVYDPAFGGGGGYVLATTIAPNQGFFVLAANDGAVLTMNTTHQVHGGTFLKNEGITADDMILISLATENYFDEARIFLNEASAMEHDFFDASKMFSFNSVMPQVYSFSSDDRMLAINSIPSVSESTSIPLSIRVPENASPVSMNLSLTEITGVFADQTIVIHDKLANQYYYPNNAPSYAFTASGDDDPDRFTIYFTTVGVPETELTSLLHAYTYGNVLYVSSQLNSALVELFNIHGQLVLSREINQGLNSIPLSLPTGTYMVKMVSAGETATRKVVIK